MLDTVGVIRSMRDSYGLKPSLKPTVYIKCRAADALAAMRAQADNVKCLAKLGEVRPPRPPRAPRPPAPAGRSERRERRPWRGRGPSFISSPQRGIAQAWSTHVVKHLKRFESVWRSRAPSAASAGNTLLKHPLSVGRSRCCRRRTRWRAAAASARSATPWRCTLCSRAWWTSTPRSPSSTSQTPSPPLPLPTLSFLQQRHLLCSHLFPTGMHPPSVLTRGGWCRSIANKTKEVEKLKGAMAAASWDKVRPQRQYPKRGVMCAVHDHLKQLSDTFPMHLTDRRVCTGPRECQGADTHQRGVAFRRARRARAGARHVSRPQGGRVERKIRFIYWFPWLTSVNVRFLLMRTIRSVNACGLVERCEPAAVVMFNRCTAPGRWPRAQCPPAQQKLSAWRREGVLQHGSHVKNRLTSPTECRSLRDTTSERARAHPRGVCAVPRVDEFVHPLHGRHLLRALRHPRKRRLHVRTARREVGAGETPPGRGLWGRGVAHSATSPEIEIRCMQLPLPEERSESRGGRGCKQRAGGALSACSFAARACTPPPPIRTPASETPSNPSV
jgi:hypothetical protein